jgi:hypothetical protein
LIASLNPNPLKHLLEQSFPEEIQWKVKEQSVMSEVEEIIEEIKRTEVILKESQENYEKDPSYSSQLLLMSTENYLSDLLKKLDGLQKQ